MREVAVDLGSQPVRNRCQNPKMAVNLNHWVAQVGGGAATLSRVVDTPYNYARVTWTTEGTVPSGGGILYNGSGLSNHVTAGVPVFVSIRVRCSIAQTVRPVLAWRDSSGAVVGAQSAGSNTSLSAGVWTGLSLTATPPAGATRLVFSVLGTGAGAVNWPVGCTFDATRFLIGNTGQMYADGDSPGWAWAGTLGVSESVGYPWALDAKVVRQEVVNQLPRPTLEAADWNDYWTNGGGLSSATRVTEPSAMGGVALEGVCAGTAGGYMYVGGGLPGKKFRVVAGMIATALIRMRIVSGNLTTIRANMVPRNAANGGAGDVIGPAVTPRAVGEWTWIRVSGTLPASTDWVHFQARIDTSTVGQRFQVDTAMVVIQDTEYTGEFATGDTPGWRWLGDPRLSESTGFPYTLESIAGKPAFDQTGPGSGTLVQMPATATGDQGFTAYHVFELVGDVFDGNVMLRYGKLQPTLNDNDGVYLNRVDAGGGVGAMRSYLARLGANGTSHFGGGPLPLPTSGVHVASTTVNTGWTAHRSRVDAVLYSTAIDPAMIGGSMGTSRWVQTYADTANRKILRHLVFQEEHSEATQARVVAWLARRHGSTIPAGY